MVQINPKRALEFRKRQSFVSPELLKAFSIVASLHLCLFIFFKISSVMDPNKLPLLKPVVVEIDLTQAKKMLQDVSCVLPVDVEVPTFEMPVPSFVVELPFQKWQESDADFSEIEKMAYQYVEFEEL